MKKETKTISLNRKAYHNYFVESEYQSGIQLSGSEIKSIRNGNINISDSFCSFGGKGKMELYIKNMYIKPYSNRCLFNVVDSNRDRKLLLTKHELNKLKQKVSQKGMTIVPTKVIINENGYCKVIIGLCKGKHNYDKREDLKKRDIERDIERNS